MVHRAISWLESCSQTAHLIPTHPASLLMCVEYVLRLQLPEGRASVHKEFRNVSNTESSAPRKLWSPIYRAFALAVMFGMVFGGFALVQPQAASAQSAAVVTDYLNLRSEPTTDAGIIAVMAPGASITVDGGGQDGFLPVTHGGNSGWAHADWISVGGSAPTPSTGATGSATVIDGALNLRSGPSTGNSVITVMSGGSSVSLTGEVAGGFLGVVYNGTSGWAFADYLRTGSAAPAPSQPAPSNPGVGDTVTGTMVTTDSLNVRSGPSTSNGVVTTIPGGVTVEIMGSASGVWYPVRYAGNKGWSHGDWLSSGSASTPAPAPSQPAPTPAPAPGASPIGDTVVSTMYVSTGLNLRSGPGTSNSVLTVMPGGATVSVMGDPVNGFYPLTFAGTKGWASGEYLQSAAPAVPAPPSGGSAYTKDEIIQIIYAAADKYGQPRADMLRVAQCESVLDPNAVNSSSGASGLFQFMPSTFAFTPFADQDIFDPVVSANAAGWMWDNGMRNHWVCQ